MVGLAVEVSVVIPVYNPGVFLRRSLDSVLSQSFNDLEGIVIDDGSTEDLTRVATHPDPRFATYDSRTVGCQLRATLGF